MDITIRNIDRSKYRLLKSQAAVLGLNIGELINRAIMHFLAQPQITKREWLLSELPVFNLGSKNKNLSREIDQILYD